jgi:hypothetical protein
VSALIGDRRPRTVGVDVIKVPAEEVGGRGTTTFQDCEARIQRGLEYFIDVSNALLTIKIGKLYSAAGYSTFEEYCQQRWSIGRNYGNKLVVAAATVQALARDLPEMGTTVPTPSSERQVRALRAAPEHERAASWTAAVELAGGGQPTVAHVQRAVEQRRPHGEQLRGITELPPSPATAEAEVDGDRRSTQVPSASRRPSLIDEAHRLLLDLQKVTRRLDRVVGDDRFTRNRAAIGRTITGPLWSAYSDLGDLLAEVGSKPLGGADRPSPFDGLAFIRLDDPDQIAATIPQACRGRDAAVRVLEAALEKLRATEVQPA